MAVVVKPAEQDTKLKALEALERDDNWSPAQWRAIAVAGSGFLTDSYDNFVVSLLVPMIGYVYFENNKNAVPNFEAGWLKAASSYGNLVGQLIFGILGDLIGRKKIYGIALVILVVGALGCSLAAQPAKGLSIISVISIWRFILGVGVGGDYPVSSVITSEFATTKNRGALIAMVFAMQGIGILLAAGMATATIAVIGKGSIEDDPKNLDYAWRFLAGFGAVPALAAVYYRMTISESPRYTLNVEGNHEQAAHDAMNHVGSGVHSKTDSKRTVSPIKAYGGKPTINISGRFASYFSKWKHAKILLATSMCWFLLDIGYYGTNLNTSSVLKAIGYSDSSHGAYWAIWTTCIGQLIIALCGNVPGYFFSVVFIDRWGRKPIQVFGFLMLTLCFAILGIFYNYLKTSNVTLFVVVYSVAQFFFNFGPNTTTFIYPAEVFPTAVRSSAHGISAASGKLGAIIAAQLFSIVADMGGAEGKGAFTNGTLIIFAGLCFIGMLFTFLLPETAGKSLEEISEELE